MNKSDLTRDFYMLKGPLAKKGYDWWWHSFTGYHTKTGKAKSFFIEYFIINPGLGENQPVFGQLPGQTKKPSYVMIKAGAWGEGKKQIHNFYPITKLVVSKDKLQVEVGDCYLSETSMRGAVSLSEEEAQAHPEYMSDAGSMRWDLSIEKRTAFHVGYGAAKPFRLLNAFEMFWHAEGMKTQYSGTVEFDGEEYCVLPETSYGYADKNWGSDFTSPWVWLSSCHIKSRLTNQELCNSVFDIGGGRPKVFHVPLDKKLLMDFNYEGKSYEYNFSKIWLRSHIQFKCYETKDKVIWKIQATGPESGMRLVASCDKKDMLLVNYEAPDGTRLHKRLWNGGTATGRVKLYERKAGKYKIIDDMDFWNAGCEYGKY